MANFGHGAGPYNYGQVAGFIKLGATAISGIGTTEGTNRLTYTVELIGLYRVSTVLRVRTTGVGSLQGAHCRMTHNNGTAMALEDVSVSGFSIPDLALTAAPGTYISQEAIVAGIPGTNIQVSVVGAGTYTTPAVIDVYMSIERM